MSRLVLASFVCLAMSGTAAFADTIEMPNRKAGLWELKVSGNQMASPTIQQCTDATTDKDMRTSFGPMGKNACEKQDIKKTATGYSIDSVCNVAGMASTSHIDINGDFNSSYTINISSHRTGGPAGVPADHDMVMTATWLGPCKADQKPGDMIMPGGMKMNISDIQKMRAMMPNGAPKQ